MPSTIDLDPQPLQLDGVLPHDEVHVWHSDLAAPVDGVEALFSILDAEEKARASRLRMPGPREQFLITRAFLKITLAEYLQLEARDIHFRATAFGKPEMLEKDCNLQFNLSHSEGAALVAIARDRRVGVDVEKIRDDLDLIDLADRFFSAPESRWLRAQPPAERVASFFACWTAKEAYVKASGEGMSIPLNGFGVIPPPGGSRFELEVYGNPEETKRWSLCQLDPGPGFRGALVVEGTSCRVRVGKWPTTQ